MSIRDFITLWTRGAQPGLWWHDPAFPGAESKRFMLLTAEIREAIAGPWESVAEERKLSELRGHLDAFVEGRRISVAPDPYRKEKTAYIARVDPVEKEIWDIRKTDPNPGIRVLGSFAETNVFVSLAWEYRSQLDGPGGPLWEAFIQRAEHAWKRLFQTLKPHSGADVSDYISEKFFLV